MKITKISVNLLDFMGTDLSVCNAARVSFDKESQYEEYEVTHGDVAEQINKICEGLFPYSWEALSNS